MISKGAGDLETTRSGNVLVSSKSMLKAIDILNGGDAMLFYVFTMPVPHVSRGLYKILQETEAVIIPFYIKGGYTVRFFIKSLRPRVVFGAPLRKEDILNGKIQYLKSVLKSLAS